MSFKVIIEVPSRGSAEAKHKLLEQYGLDYTHLLELTLSNWDLLTGNDDDVLRASLEDYMHRHWPRRKPCDYAKLVEALHLLSTALNQFFRALEPVLSIVMSSHGADSENAVLRLVGYMGTDPIVEVAPKPWNTTQR